MVALTKSVEKLKMQQSEKSVDKNTRNAEVHYQNDVKLKFNSSTTLTSDHVDNEYIDPSTLVSFPFYLTLEEGPIYGENIYETIQDQSNFGLSSLCIAIVIAAVSLFVIIGSIAAFFWFRHSPALVNVPHHFEPIISTCPTDTLDCRRDFVRNMTRDAWAAYRAYAWGHVTLKPASKSYDDLNYGFFTGATIIAAMSTLHVMDLKEEWTVGRKWIETEFNYSSVDREVPVVLVVQCLLGGLLSAYALSGDAMFKVKALEVATILEGAHNNQTGLAYHLFTPKTGIPKPQEVNFLPDVGIQQPEFIFAAALANSIHWKKRLAKVRQMLVEIEKPRGLYESFIFVTIQKRWIGSKTTISHGGPAFYYNLLCSYIQSDRTDADMLKIYADAVDSMWHNGLFRVLENGSIFTSDYDLKTNTSAGLMENAACQAGAMFALGAKELEKSGSMKQAVLHWRLAINLTSFCQQAVDRTKTKMLPTIFSTIETTDPMGYIEYTLAENYFFLWRLTGDSRYRDAAWQLAQALYAYCRTPSGGYSTILNVNSIPTKTNDYQNPVFLSATLKYLYLTFVNETVLPVDRWIFNTFGHPLPIDSEYSTN